MVVKLAASMAVSLSAMRQNRELPAKAIMVITVRTIILVRDIVSLSLG